jgi:hypothetical protein
MADEIQGVEIERIQGKAEHGYCSSRWRLTIQMLR